MGKNSFVLLSGGRKAGGGLWVAKILLLFKICVIQSNQSQECMFLQDIEVKGSIGMVDDTIGSVCLR